MSLPTFIGIGAPKSGTTWIANCLQKHPEVFMSPVKEPEFWKFSDSEIRVSEYKNYFKNASGFKAIGEFSVRYLSLPDVPARIKRCIPGVKLILSVRNPVDQVQSWYWHLRRQGALVKGLRAMSFTEAMIESSDVLIEPAKYFERLKPWLNEFPREQILIVFFDDISSNPLSVLDAIYNHIGVEQGIYSKDVSRVDSSVRLGVSPKSQLHEGIHRITYGILNRLFYRPLRYVLGSRRAGQINSRLRVRRFMEKRFFKEGYEPIDLLTRQQLLRNFEGDISALAQLTGRNLDCWLQG